MTARGKICAVFTALWAAFIFSNSFKIGSASTSMSSGFVDTAVEFLQKIGIKSLDVDLITTIIRKSAHFTEFLLLGVLIALCFTLSDKRVKFYIMSILFLCLLAGVTDEFIQSFIAGRSSEVRDVVINFSGSIVGVAIVAAVANAKFKKRRFRR